MSLFDPTDVRKPDQRRKQLMQKLAQQGRRAVPLPGRAGYAAGGSGVGRLFQGAAQARSQQVHPGNVMSSIMSRLGVGGGPQLGEFSPGVGRPIGNPGQGYGDPFSRAPQAITGGTPIAPNDANIIPPHPAPPVSGGVSIQPPVGGGYPEGPLAAPPINPNGYGDMVSPGTVGQFGGPVSQGGLVPLGNGMYYDPASDQVVNQSQPSGGGGLYTKSY